LESRARRISGRVGEELASHVGRPGKMLRARFCLLLGGALGVEQEKAEAAARAMELVHNASLLHDDCVDEAELRRGQPTPNKVFGTTVGLLLGDLAFSQGLEEAVEISPNATRYLVTTVREMTVGELQEEFLKGAVDVSLDAYMGVAARKTGALFEWAGNVLSELSPFPHERADPPRLACAAGILLQIVDDIHDYTLPENVSGKDEGQDVANRRLTLPCLLALQDAARRGEFLRLWEASEPKAIAAFLKKNGFIDAARAKGRELVDSMLTLCKGLPCKAEAVEMRLFIEVMARREF
jgi:octaprenyl-diphosphate synthase